MPTSSFNSDSSLLLGLSQSLHWIDAVAKRINSKAVLIKKKTFADQEILVEIPVSVRDKDVFLCQSTSSPANENIMELLIAVDALKRASASSVSLIIPYFGYARQDRKVKGREPITAKLVANLITFFGLKRIITFDLHSPQIQGFFDIPIDHLTFLPQIVYQLLKTTQLTNFVLVAPDHGGFQRVKKINDYLKREIAILNKMRPAQNRAKVDFILGDVKGKNVILIDDMIDTASTLISSLKFLKNQGAKDLYVVASHPVFSDHALENLKVLFAQGILKEVWVSNTIYIKQLKNYPFLKIYSIDQDISAILQLISSQGSLFQYGLEKFKKLNDFKKND